MRLFYSLILCFYSTFVIAQTRKISGKITDSQNKQALAFVSVAIAGTTQGTLADIDGKFTINIKPNDYLIVSYVGYESQKIAFHSILTSHLEVLLVQKNNQLNEVNIRPTEDPAYQIIRRVVANKRLNDPEQLPSFRYNAYTIAGLGLKVDQLKAAQPKLANKNLKTPKEPKPPKIKTLQEITEDSLMTQIGRSLFKNYLFVTESYTLREFVKPNLSKEKILATRFSGIKKSPLALVAGNFQPFGFYRDFILMADKTYENPITNSGIKQYEFELADTLVHEKDSTFVIKFQPKVGRNFEGLAGVLYINSAVFAIENVVAQPAATLNRKLHFRIQQMYENLQGHWFPKQLNTELYVYSIQKNSTTGRIDSTTSQWSTRSYIYNTDFEHSASKNSFTDISQDMASDARTQTDQYWAAVRKDSLQGKEKATYHAWDMMPDKTKKKINRASDWFFDLSIANAIPISKNIEIPLKYLLNSVNQYEKTRLGFGLRTTPTLTHWLVLEGGLGYGFGDKALKYEGNLQVNLSQNLGNYLRFSYLQDLEEPGTNANFQIISSNLLASPIRKFVTYRMDSVSRLKIDLGLRPFRKTQLRTWLFSENRRPAVYNYSYQDTNNQSIRSYNNTEIGFTLRLASEEKLVRFGRSEFSTQPPLRQFMLQISKGLKDVLGGSFDYLKIDLQYSHSFLIHGFGKTTFQLNAGKVMGNAPYSYLFNGMGIGGVRNNLWVINSFQTMGVYEFLSDQYTNLFIAHNFGKLLFRSNFKYSQPELSLHQGYGIGQLSQPNAHQNLEFKTLQKGFYESGLYIDNIARIPYAGVAYVGVGAGLFYRYGPNALPNTNQNLSFRWGISFSF